MKTIGELKNYLAKQIKSGGGTITKGKISIQVYNSLLNQFNVSFGSHEPSIKFEEQSGKPEQYNVSVAFDDECVIKYNQSKIFMMSDDIEMLQTAFPDGFLISQIVSELLKIK